MIKKKFMPPLPIPTSSEKQDKAGQSAFIKKCMQVQKNENLPQDQKLARCFSQYRRSKQRKKAKGNVSEPQWEESNGNDKVDIFY